MRTLPTAVHTLLCAAAVFISACATTPIARFAADDEGLSVVVENHGWQDLSVFAASGGGSRRLGSVSSGRTETFHIRGLQGSSTVLELVADPLASSRRLHSGRLLVSEGQTVVWTIHEGRLGGDVTIR